MSTEATGADIRPGDLLTYRDSEGRVYERNLVLSATPGVSTVELFVRRFFPDGETVLVAGRTVMYVGLRAEVELTPFRDVSLETIRGTV